MVLDPVHDCCVCSDNPLIACGGKKGGGCASGPLNEIVGLCYLVRYAVNAEKSTGVEVVEEAVPEGGTKGGLVVVVVRADEDVCVEQECRGLLLAQRVNPIFCGICSNVSPFRSVKL